MKLEDLRRQQHKITLRERVILRIVESTLFGEAYSIATDEDKEIAIGLLKSKDKKRLTQWMKRQATKDYSMQSLRQLRERGRQLAIPYASKMVKAELLSEIELHERRYRTKGKSND